jgi:hypothetical protein
MTVHIVVAVGQYGSLYAARGSTYDIRADGYQHEDCGETMGTLGLPPSWEPQPSADPSATGYAQIYIDQGVTEGSIEVTIQAGCGWYEWFGFVKGQDGVWHHDLVHDPEDTGAYIVSGESHGTVTGGQ